MKIRTIAWIPIRDVLANAASRHDRDWDETEENLKRLLSKEPWKNTRLDEAHGSTYEWCTMDSLVHWAFKNKEEDLRLYVLSEMPRGVHIRQRDCDIEGLSSGYEDDPYYGPHRG